MSLKHENGGFAEKHANDDPAYESGSPGEHKGGGAYTATPEDLVESGETNKLHQDLKGRHMQMIAMQVSSSNSH